MAIDPLLYDAPLEEEPPPREAPPVDPNAPVDPSQYDAPPEEQYVSPGLGGVPDPAAVEEAYQAETQTGLQDVAAPAGEAILSAVPEPLSGPVRNLADIVGQPVGGLLDAASDVATGFQGGGVSGGAVAGLGAISEPFNRIPEEATQRIQEGKGVIPTPEEIVANPGSLLSVAATLGTETIPQVLGQEGYTQWVNENPEAVQEAQQRGGNIEVYDTYQREGLGLEPTPPGELVNPLDRAGEGNWLQQGANILGAVPEAIGSYGNSMAQGTLGPFVGSQLLYAAMDPTTLIPPGVGKRVASGIGKAVTRIPGVRKLTELAPATKATIAAEEAGAAGQELLTARSRGTTAPGAVTPEVPPAAVTPPSNGVTPPTTRTIESGWGMGRQTIEVPVDAQGRPIIPETTGGGVTEWPVSRREASPARAATRVPEPTVSPTTGARQAPAAIDPVLADRLRTRLTDAGFDDYQLQVVNHLDEVLPAEDLARLQGKEVGGYHDVTRKTIALSLENARVQELIDGGVSPEVARSITTTAFLDHEILHATRKANLFTAPEWQSLVDTAIKEKYNTKILNDPVYKDLAGDPVSFQEEMVAHLYQDWRDGRLMDMDPVARGLLERVFTFLAQLGNSLKDTMPGRVLQDLERGEIGKRSRPESMTPASRDIPETAGVPGVAQRGKRSPATGETRAATPQQTRDFAVVRRSPSYQTSFADEISEPLDPPTKGTIASDPLAEIPGNPRYHFENRAAFQGPGPGSGNLSDFDIKTAWNDAIASIPDEKVRGRVANELAGLTPPSAETFRNALSRDWEDILFYEDGAAAIRDHLDVPTGVMNTFINLLGATSQNTLPYNNTMRTLSALAEHMQGLAVRTPSTTPQSIADAVNLPHMTSPKYYSYSGQFKHDLGMIDEVPGAVIDVHMVRSLGMPTNRHLSPAAYNTLSNFFESTRDIINRTNPPLDPAAQLQTKHVQSALWREQRGAKPGGNPIAAAFTDATERLQTLAPELLDNGKMTVSTFMDPRVIDFFGDTAEFAARMPYADFTELSARGVVARAYEAANALPPKQRVAFNDTVLRPFRTGLRRDVYPALMQTFAGVPLRKGRSQDFVRIIGNMGATGDDVVSVPLGAQMRGMPRFQVRDLELAEAMLRESLGLENIEVSALFDPNDSHLSTPGGQRSSTYELSMRSRDVTPETIAQFSDQVGYPVTATAFRSGKVNLVLETMPGEVADANRVNAALHSTWPDASTMVDLREKVRVVADRTGRSYTDLKDEFINGNHTTLLDRAASDESQRLASGRLNGLKQFDAQATKLRAEWESNARRYLGEPDDLTTDLAAASPNLRSEGEFSRLRDDLTARHNARVANSTAPEGYQRQLADLALAQPRLYRGGFVTQDAFDTLQAAAGGRVRFRDGYTPRGRSLGEVAEELYGDVHSWLHGYDRLGQPEPWTKTSKDWQTWEKRFNPNGDTDVTKMSLNPGNPAADTEHALAREQFMHDVWGDATRSTVEPTSKTALGRAWDSYTGAVRPMILFNWMNVPRYVLQNLSSNSINITARGGGIGVAADVFTDFRRMKGVYGNLRKGDPTYFNALERKMGVGTSPNVQMTQNKYFQQMNQKPPKGLGVVSSLVAPEFLRHMASVPDQYAREVVGARAIERGFQDLNKKMPAKIHTELNTRLGKTGIQIPQSKVNQVFRDFANEQRLITDPTTGEPFKSIGGKPGKFTPVYAAEDLRDYLFKHLDEDLKIKPDRTLYSNAIDRIYRDTKPAIKEIRTNASDQVDHALFSWRNTVGDEMLAKATLFHYWGSRQGGFYVNEGIKHPWMITSYARMMTEMEEQSQELDSPTWLRGFFQFANSPGGMSTWFSPFDFFGSMLTMADWQFSGDPDAFRDLTDLGQKMRQLPFFVHPGLQFVAYEMGLLGPDYPAPNVTGAEGFISKVGDLMNLANATDAPFMAPFNAMGVGVDADGNKVPIPTRPLNELYGRVGNAISTALAPLTGLNPVEVISPTATFDRSIATLGEQQTRLAHPDWTDHEVNTHVTDVLYDPGSAEYRDWYSRAAQAPFQAGNLPQPLSGLARIASPVSMTSVPEQRLLDTMSGLQPSGNILPRTSTDEFIQSESKYGASSTPEGRKLTEWKNEYYQLVDPVVMDARYTAPNITGCRPEGCDLKENMTIGGYEYTPEEIAGLSYTARKDLRAQYLAEQNVTEEQLTDSYQAEQRYKDSHPDAAAYLAYDQLIKNYPVPEGSDITPQEAFTKATMLTNPGFAQHVRNEMTDYATGEINYDRADDADSFLASQGVRPSVYSPIVGNEPTTVPGGYPSIAGVPSGQPLLDSVTPNVDAPLLPGPYDDVTADTTIVAPGHPLQLLDPNPRNGQMLVGSLDGEYVGWIDQTLLDVTSPVSPNGASPNGAVPAAAPTTGGGLAGLAGGAISALGGAVQGIGNALGGLVGEDPNVNPTSPQAAPSTGVTAHEDTKYGLSPWAEGGVTQDIINAVVPDSTQVGWDFRDPTNADYGNYFTEATGGRGNEHPGIDIWGAYGGDVLTPVTGKVVCTASDSGESGVNGFGCAAFKDTDTGGAGKVEVQIDGKNQSLVFGHMQTADVAYGQQVTPGTYLGAMGGMSKIPHVHLEARLWNPDGSYTIVDPTLMLSGYYG